MGVQLDALLLGPRKDIEDSRLVPQALLKGTAKDQNLKTFHLRPPQAGNALRCHAELESLLQMSALKDITFGIMSGFERPEPPYQQSKYGTHGLTSTKHSLTGKVGDHQLIQVFIAFHLLAPLFRNDLTDGEFLGQQMMVAITLVHETIHAIYKAKVFKDMKNLGKDPKQLDYVEP